MEWWDVEGWRDRMPWRRRDEGWRDVEKKELGLKRNGGGWMERWKGQRWD